MTYSIEWNGQPELKSSGLKSPEVASLIRLECWLGGERRGHAVDPRLTFFKAGAGAGVGAAVAAFGSAAFFLW